MLACVLYERDKLRYRKERLAAVDASIVGPILFPKPSVESTLVSGEWRVRYGWRG